MQTIDEIVLAKKSITEEPKKKKKVQMFQQYIIDKEVENEIKEENENKTKVK